MGSTTISRSSYLVSTDVGLMRGDIITVVGYDIEDIIKDKAVSQGRAVMLMNLGKRIDPTKPLAARSVSSAWLNNEEELL